MKISTIFFLLCMAALMFSSCSENYSNGERIGLVTQFSRSGLVFKTWEGHLNMTQTGMNSSTPFDFSVDRDNEDQKVISTLDSAAIHGWKVKLVYHETFGWNWFGNRGETNHFVTNVTVLDKDPIGNAFNHSTPQNVLTGGTIRDTIYIVLQKNCQCANCVKK